MKYELIKETNKLYTPLEQILTNRGIPIEEVEMYANLTDEVISPPEVFGEELMNGALETLLSAIRNKKKMCVIVDCDDDGFTSAAILSNYIFDLNNDYARNYIHHFFHQGKQHGLEDAMEWLEGQEPEIVLLPDAGSNDEVQIKSLYDKGVDVIILDHHIIENNSETYKYCYLINSQSPEYPNKELSGAGVVYQFCKYIDKQQHTNYADDYLDLAALGLIGDMQNLKSYETRRLITKGLTPEKITNPFIYKMWQKNKFKLGEHPTSWGVTFYIVPLVNAINRSGAQEEKEKVFKSMLKYEAFNEIPSNKKGHKVGETEQLVEQVMRICTNVKSRQTKAETAGLELLENRIKDNNMLDHKVLLFLLESPSEVNNSIRGLIANRLAAKYQRPCCILTKRQLEDDSYIYEGSARGCDKTGVNHFKEICVDTGECVYTVGHSEAFGLGIKKTQLINFVSKTDETLKDMSDEAIYKVDYIWTPNTIDGNAILDIADMDIYWGQGMSESLVAVQHIPLSFDNITMMKSNTVKITLPNKISIIKFGMPDDEYGKLLDTIKNNSLVEMDVVCRCNKNEWMGNVSPQLLLEDYQINIIVEKGYVF